MNKRLEKFDEKLTNMMINTLRKLADDDEPLVDNIRPVIDIMEQKHASTIITYIMALLSTAKNHSELTPGHYSELREFVSACETDFAGNLRANLQRNLKEHGFHNFLDPNAELREELENKGRKS